MIPIRLMAAAAAVLLVAAGCATRPCDDSAEYLSSESLPPLSLPDGVSEPQGSAAMRIPGGAPAGGGSRGDGRCLAEPPHYYADPNQSNPEGLPPSPAAAAAPVASEQASGSGAGVSLVTQEVAGFLDAWADAWSRRDADAWLAFYAQDYAPVGYDSPRDWRDAQRERFQVPAVTVVEDGSLEVDTDDRGRTTARFIQRFGQPPEVRSVVKEMVLEPSPAGRGWQIIDERILDIL
ncbi:MAG: nuclear transport factor 2 family protein [Gammaproteobacteria bacterium]